MLWHHIIQTLGHWTGIDNVNGAPYAVWSGVGSDLGELVIFGYLIRWYRQHKKHMAFHKKHMELMNGLHVQSPPATTSVWHVPDISELP